MGSNNIPSEDMGDYEEYRKKKSPPKTGPLYPLYKEGSYSAPPSALPPPLPGYQKRERKTKVYASYAVSRYTITQSMECKLTGLGFNLGSLI